MSFNYGTLSGKACISGGPPQDSRPVIRPADTVVFVGDSISDFAVIDAFVTLRANVDAFFTSRGLTPPTWINEAVSGDTTQGVLNRIGPILARDLDVVFLFIGVNDAQASVSTATFQTNLTSILDQILATRPTCRVVMIPPWLIFGVKPNGSNAFDTAMNAYRDVVRTLANARGIPFVDIRTLYFNGTDTGLLMDSVHPNAAGELWICKQVEFRLNLRETTS